MSGKQRYFKNFLPDYSTSIQNATKCDFVKDLINSYVQQIEEKFPPTLNNAEGGLYTGTAGVAFMFLKMACSGLFQKKREEFLERASIYIKVWLRRMAVFFCFFCAFWLCV